MSQCNRRGDRAEATCVVVFRNPFTREEWTACVCRECAGVAERMFQQLVLNWRKFLDTPSAEAKEESNG